MRKHLLFLLTVLFTSAAVFAQDDELPPPSNKPQEQSYTKKSGDEGEFQGFKPKRKLDFSKFIIEPNFNLSIGQGRIDAGVSPYVGYKLWRGLYGGGGLTYFYTGFKNIGIIDGAGSTQYINVNWHTYGGGVFLQYNIWKGFFARAKMEILHRKLDDLYNAYYYPQNPHQIIIPKVDKTIPALLVGVGYNLLQSKNFFFPLMVSYNLLNSVADKNYSPYPRGVVVQLGFVNIF